MRCWRSEFTTQLQLYHWSPFAASPLRGTPSRGRAAHAPESTRERRWAHQDSNLERAGYEPAALTIELWARSSVAQALRPPFQKRLQLAAARRVAQLAERLCLDLPDALAGHGEVLADFLERVLRAVA